MGRPEIDLAFAAELRFFLAPRHRGGRVRLAHDGTSSLGHVVESLGVPLPEVGGLEVGGGPVTPAYQPADGDVVTVAPIRRPQPLTAARFVLDVHLGKLARRLRIVGVDAAFPGDVADDALIRVANAQRRVLLTKDRALLCRRSLWLGAYVRGQRPDEQLADVLDRFAPALAPWTRCTSCNGLLAPVPKADIQALLQPGTRRSYQAFARCAACGRVYWRGAHSRRLAQIVARAGAAAGGAAGGGSAAGEDPAD